MLSGIVRTALRAALAVRTGAEHAVAVRTLGEPLSPCFSSVLGDRGENNGAAADARKSSEMEKFRTSETSLRSCHGHTAPVSWAPWIALNEARRGVLEPVPTINGPCGPYRCTSRGAAC